MQADFDVLIVGGGINGAGIARDAAGRGLRVCLVEKGDLAGATSSASTKMIHGGLRYLEYNEFGLVRQALKEREKLLKIAPHLIAPLRIVLPVLPDMRPAWLIRLGLWLYDHLGGKISLPPTRTLSLKNTVEGAALTPGPTKAFTYSDGWVDDARLVVTNIIDAAARGADIRTRCELMGLQVQNGHWNATLNATGQTMHVTAKCVINAAGPWADKVDALAGLSHAQDMVKVQGSHIVVPKLYEGDHAYLLQNPDRRVVFAIPYQGKFTLFGTTDTPLSGDPGAAKLTTEETEYLLTAIKRFFKKPTTPQDIIWSYSGVRALFGDANKNASELSRDYQLVMDPPGGTPPFLSILGGKITTYRSLSEKAVNIMAERLGQKNTKTWTGTTPLPGGDLGAGGIHALHDKIIIKWPFLAHATAQRLAHAYGTRIFEVFTDVTHAADLGEDFGHGLTEKEVRYLINKEWARSAEDILWRRSKIGLFLSDKQRNQFQHWLDQEVS